MYKTHNPILKKPCLKGNTAEKLNINTDIADMGWVGFFVMNRNEFRAEEMKLERERLPRAE